MQIVSFSPVVPVQVEFDGYIPLVIRFKGNASWPPKYWRTGDFKRNLIEIAVSPTTGEICKIVVVSIQEVNIDFQATNDFGAQHCNGIPNASQAAWERNKTRIDVEGKVQGLLVRRTLTVFLDENQTSFSLVKCGRITFLLSTSKILCGFQVIDLTDQEIENFHYAIGVQNSS